MLNRKTFVLLIAIVAITPLPLGAIAAAQDSAAYKAEWENWKAGRARSVVAPGRPLSYTGLTWLKPGLNTIGSDKANQVRLPGRGVPARAGILIRDGARVRFEPAPALTATVDGRPATATDLRSDAEARASQVEIGSAGFRIIKRVDSIGVRAWDAERATLRSFAGLSHFDLSSRWRITGRFAPLEVARRVAVMTESGVAEEHDIVGTVHATIDGVKYALTAFGSSRTSLFIVFADASSGEESYGFRFLRAALDTATNDVTLDFNFSYNPDCAFSPYTTCPLPPRENRIRTKVLAGERRLTQERSK
jgi:uncharacterized protein